MSSTAQEEYDRVLYPGSAHTQTHPDRLATLATLFGMQPAPLERCRVLEIGCTDGGNLIPMAYTLPNAEFVGIDISKRSLAVGQECLAELGLNNIRLLECDIMDVSGDFGQFDYIIAHGIYSWVPKFVREKILSICQTHLAPQGVAYISYNAYPGCHIRDMVRGMMRYHVEAIDDPDDKRRHSAALLRFLAESQPEANIYHQLLNAELERIERFPPAAFYHDDLAEIRAPFYFHEFIEQAAQYELQYLSEAALPEMQEEAFAPNVIQALHAITDDRIRRAQYLDFLKCRRFRQTLLCHRAIALTTLRVDTVRSFFISSQARPVSTSPVLDHSTVEEFAVPGSGGARLKTSDRVAKTAVIHLGEVWSQSVSFEALIAAVSARLGEPPDTFAESSVVTDLAEALLAMYAAGLIEFHVHPGTFATVPGDYPMVSPVVRWCLAKGAQEVTNLRHRTIGAGDPVGAHLMQLLDGTRNRQTLVDDLATFCAARGLKLTAEAIAAGMEESLNKLARMAVLVQ